MSVFNMSGFLDNYDDIDIDEVSTNSAAIPKTHSRNNNLTDHKVSQDDISDLTILDIPSESRRKPYLFEQGGIGKASTDKDIADTFALMKKDYSNGRVNHWAETQDAEASGIMLDLDIFQSFPEVQITQSDKCRIAQSLIKFITSQFKFNNEEFTEDHTIAQIDKPCNDGELVFSAKHGAYKDGIHYVIPTLLTDRKTKKWIISAIKSEGIISNELKNYAFVNEDDLLDTNSAHVPVLLLGSAKPKKQRFYPLAKVYAFDREDDQFRDTTHLYERTRVNPCLELSLNRWGIERVLKEKQVFELTDKAKETMLAWEQDQEIKRQASLKKELLYKPDAETIAIMVANTDGIEAWLYDVIEYLSVSRSTNNRTWRSVIACLKNMSQLANIADKKMYALMDKFSQKAESSYNEKHNQSIYEYIKPRGYFSLLMMMVRTDEPKACRQLYISYYKICPKQSRYRYYSDYIKLIRNHDGSKRESVTFTEIKEWATSCITAIDNTGAQMFLIKDRIFNREQKIYFEEMIMQKRKTLLSSLEYNVLLYSEVKTDKKNIKKPKSSDSDTNKDDKVAITFAPQSNVLSGIVYGLMIDNEIPSYQRTEYVPFSCDKPSPTIGKYNVFAGFPIKHHQATKQYDFEKSTMYEHLTKVLTPEDKTNFAIKWFAHMVQKPEEIPGTAPVFYSYQGAGKDTIGKFMRLLVGTNVSDVFDNPDHFFSKFNSSASGLLFAILNEIADKGEAFKKHDLLKSYITREESKIEPKGLEQYTQATYTRYAFFTNSENALCVENSDRRFALFRCDNTRIGDQEYFNSLNAEMNDPDFIKCAFEYMKNLDISEFNVRKTPETAYKNEQKIYCMKNSLKFVKHLFDENYKFRNNNLNKSANGILIQAKSLYDLYQTYCVDIHEKPTTYKNFVGMLANIDIVRKLHNYKDDTVNKKTRSYLLNRTVIKESFRKYLKMPSFDFDEPENEDEDENEDGDDEDEMMI
jgi:hypothetical protein